MSNPTVRILPAVEERVESGAIQFGDDWPGLFIRGDHAGYLMLNIRHLLKVIPPLDDPQANLAIGLLSGLADTIGSEVMVK